jgi:hypothetical protein
MDILTRQHQRQHSAKLAFALAVGVASLGLSTFSPSARADDRPISFVNEVLPVLTKSGCNIGVCHAKAGNGQNGFQLSLLGYEPDEDIDHLTLESRGRRLSPGSPESSLLLLKATGRVPHGGGKRLDPESADHALLVEWIRQGAKSDVGTAPKLTAFEVQPSRGTVPLGGQQQLKAVAKYADGLERDVTSWAVFESNDTAMAEVAGAGLVKTLDVSGKVSVMVRFQDRITVFSAAVPLGAPVESLPPVSNFIDDHLFANLKQLGIPPSPVCDDATFLRRVTLDIAGRLPTDAEATAFISSSEPDKRAKVVDELLRSPDYADFFAGKWSALLKNRRDDASDMLSNFAFHAWVRDSMLANTPYDQFVRQLLAATGTVIGNPPVAWYKRVKEPKEQLEDVAQLFLGVRMQCAQCHHHPFERWSQEDYYALSAFFSQVGRKPSGTRGEDLIFHKRGVASAKHMKTGAAVLPGALGDKLPAIAADEDPRLKLADWMRSPTNPFFARSLVNRYWKHFFHRGLIEPEDDIRDSNPPTNPELLAALERHFIESGYNLKELIRVITTSTAYQLSSTPNNYNAGDRQNYSRYYPRRMQAEVLLDAIDAISGSRTDFANLPQGTRAVALPDNSYNNSTAFLRVFGRPEGASVCECERVQSSSLAQSLHLINAADIKGKLAFAGGRAERLAKDTRPVEDRIRELYLVAFSRLPREDELQTAVAFVNELPLDAEGKPLDAARGQAENYQDLLWALINTKEFLFNH